MVRENRSILHASWLDSPLGTMLAISDEKALHFLEFVDWKGLEREIESLCVQTQSDIVSGNAEPISLIEAELTSYFEGTLKEFKTPLYFLGSPFQNSVWEELMRVPYGTTRSYSDQAKAIGKPLAYRAVANANGVNRIGVVIPCHRIINNNGKLGGYGGGLERKKWLIEHEKRHAGA